MENVQKFKTSAEPPFDPFGHKGLSKHQKPRTGGFRRQVQTLRNNRTRCRSAHFLSSLPEEPLNPDVLAEVTVFFFILAENQKLHNRGVSVTSLLFNTVCWCDPEQVPGSAAQTQTSQLLHVFLPETQNKWAFLQLLTSTASRLFLAASLVNTVFTAS